MEEQPCPFWTICIPMSQTPHRLEGLPRVELESFGLYLKAISSYTVLGERMGPTTQKQPLVT